MRGTPNEWAERLVELYYGYEADRIVAEVNNGGDMIEALIRDKDKSVAFQAVRATRGKILRAEPISALYERGLVHHAGHFAILEDQMCNYTGGIAEKSPDRLDALVWALTQLSGNNSGHIGGGADLALTY
jgi:phage terminase large subunit-like protein